MYLLNIYLFNLAASGHSCSMWDLVPCPGLKLGPPALEGKVRPLDHREVPGQACVSLALPPCPHLSSLQVKSGDCSGCRVLAQGLRGDALGDPTLVSGQGPWAAHDLTPPLPGMPWMPPDEVIQGQDG